MEQRQLLLPVSNVCYNSGTEMSAYHIRLLKRTLYSHSYGATQKIPGSCFQGGPTLLISASTH